MKAAVVFKIGERPVYTDFPEPTVQNRDEVLITMKTAAIKLVDKSRADGTHYSTQRDISQAEVIGGDGVGLLKNGKRVCFNEYGQLCE